MIKKLTYLLLPVLLLAGTAAAEFDYKRIGVGVNAGITVAGASSDAEGTKSRTGYSFGLEVNHPISTRLVLQAEFLILGKGYGVSDTLVLDENDNPIGRIDWKALIGYLEIPITARMKIVDHGKYRPYLLGGGFWAMTVQEKQRLTGTALVVDTDLRYVRKFDWGITIGAGIEIKTGQGWLNFDFRYDLSTESIFKLTRVDQVEYHSRVWLFKMSYWTDLGSLF